MKLKMIAIAAAMLASGAANAALTSAASGDGSLFFNAWNDVESYSLNLSTYTVDSFAAAIAGPGNFSEEFGDAGLTSFLNGSNTFSWNILAADTKGINRIVATYSSAPTTKAMTGGDGRATAAAIGVFALDLNEAGLSNADSVKAQKGTKAYAGATEGGSAPLTFSTTGSVLNNSYSSGLGFRLSTAAATGISSVAYSTAFYNESAGPVKAWLQDGKLHVAAVPEPETYALFLAGLGLVGTIIRRRQRSI